MLSRACCPQDLAASSVGGLVEENRRISNQVRLFQTAVSLLRERCVEEAAETCRAILEGICVEIVREFHVG